MENEPQPLEEVPNDDAGEAARPEKRASRVPLVLTIVSLLIWFGFQTVELFVERNNLRSFRQNLESAMQEAQKVRTQFESLITKTVELANQGNAGAKAAVDELEKRGIPIKSAPPSAK
ncbi:MAG TPA: hypothetical protein VFU31_27370 [Candidatus Binatia bacterium]|nr:hypothetical protein [Candidatus Binatia bacterium]